MIDRRRFLVSVGASAVLTGLGLRSSGSAASILKFQGNHSFSFDGLINRAQEMARHPYVVPVGPPNEILDGIDYDARARIRFDTDAALFANGPGPYPVTFFILGGLYRLPVRIYVVEESQTGPTAKEIVYDASYFEMGSDNPAGRLPKDGGFAGFRFQESRVGNQTTLDWRNNDWAVFLGASYFRAIGELYQYGLSARGVAIDTALADRPEEFPRFSEFYIETPGADGDNMVVYALLDGPSITGAYRFDLHRREGVVMEIQSTLFLRKAVDRLGLAPLTSMYWFSEARKPTGLDWRPDVHDSGGLALWTGSGERLWRPLNNPREVTVSSFVDTNPHGFGLLQRDRNFDHYLDGVHYERRPSLWVEPLDGWGAGTVQLVETPTDNEAGDNINAMWVPNDPGKPGTIYHLRYRLHWLADEPYPNQLARCVATRVGRAGHPGHPQPDGVNQFVIEFIGTPLADLSVGVKPEPIVWVSRGNVSNALSAPVPDGVPGHWRAQFDLAVTGNAPVEMRLFLRTGGTVLSETWLYQYAPAKSAGSELATEE
jgi:periplasmic glucans biosynthesis protein